jgi:phenylpropionate dioxygenase-like ring-hydroxylating dioxygenase large terminal subunit
MLTKEQNDLLTQTGPGTPCGKLLRSYWQPITASEEMPIGGDPMPIRIMSEDLVLFRDDKDRLGLISQFCSHRGTDLSYGRVEDGGLRCLYHGWLFDIHGKCLDQPAQPADKKFCDKAGLTAYPVQEKGGAIWAYLGEGEPPMIPDFQFLIGPEANRQTFRTRQMCNWLQGLESVIDPAHTTYLHRRPVGTRSIRSGFDVAAMRGTEPPEIKTEATNVGMRIYALHKSANGRRYLRVNNYVYPCGATPTTGNAGTGYQGRWYVPIDDHSHYYFEFIYRHSQPVDKEALKKFRADNVASDSRHVRRAENRYLQDRQEMKSPGGSSAGMGDYFPAQDAFAIESQGVMRDRAKDHLGSTDIVITATFRTLLKAIKQIQDGGDAPGLIRGNPTEYLADFVCFEGPIGDDEDGASYCRKVLASRAAAE